MSTGTGALLCGHCGRPIGANLHSWIGGVPYHHACTMPPTGKRIIGYNAPASPINLVIEVDELKAKLDASECLIDRLNDHIKQLERENAALRKDKERLDCLDSVPEEQTPENDEIIDNAHWIWENAKPGELREAIDEAFGLTQ